MAAWRVTLLCNMLNSTGFPLFSEKGLALCRKIIFSSIFKQPWALSPSAYFYADIEVIAFFEKQLMGDGMETPFSNEF